MSAQQNGGGTGQPQESHGVVSSEREEGTPESQHTLRNDKVYDVHDQESGVVDAVISTPNNRAVGTARTSPKTRLQKAAGTSLLIKDVNKVDAFRPSTDASQNKNNQNTTRSRPRRTGSAPKKLGRPRNPSSGQTPRRPARGKPVPSTSKSASERRLHDQGIEPELVYTTAWDNNSQSEVEDRKSSTSIKSSPANNDRISDQQVKEQIAALTALVGQLAQNVAKISIQNKTPQKERQGEYERYRPKSPNFHEVFQETTQAPKPMEPPKFDGDIEKAISWLYSFREATKTNGWSEPMAIRQIVPALTKGAKSWFRTTWRGELPRSINEFEAEFEMAYLGSDITEHLRSKLSNLRQKNDQDLLSYYFEAMEICSMMDNIMPQPRQVQCIINGMRPQPRRDIRLVGPETTLDLQKVIRNWLMDNRRDYDDRSQATRFNEGRAPNQVAPSEPIDRDKWCLNCGNKGHRMKSCPEPFDQDRVNQRKEEWQQRSAANAPKDKPKVARINQEVSSDDEDTITPQKVESDEFISCISFNKAEASIKNESKDFTKVEKSYTPRIKCRINGKATEATLDTGATATVLSTAFVQSTNSSIDKWMGSTVSLADGKRVKPTGSCWADITYRDRTFTVHAVVLDKAPDLLLGQDYLGKAKIIISYADELALYSDEYSKQFVSIATPKSTNDTTTQTEMVSGDNLKNNKDQDPLYIEYVDHIKVGAIGMDPKLPYGVKTKRKITIPACRRARIEVKISKQEDEIPYIMDSCKESRLQIIPGIGRKKSAVLDVVNISKTPVTIERRALIAQAVPLDADGLEDQTQVRVPSKLTHAQATELTKLLGKFDDVFVNDNESIGIVPFIQHRIDTGDNQPIRSKPYRVSVSEQQTIQKLVDEMLEADIIRPSRSYWASPVVLVKKKGTTDLRFCVDYRKLNKITKVDPYPVPNMDTVLEVLAGNYWFSKLDVKAMYWQVLMEPESREKTAFVVHCGQYEFNVMPFGLISAPMTAMRVMDQITRGLDKHCFVFYDDILVFTKTFDEHLEELEKLMTRLREANVKLNAKKCDLMLNSVLYLGHEVTPEGIKPDQSKIAAIQSFKSPRSMTEARSFIGMCNFFRRYIKGFALIARPIHDTIKVKQQFRWTPEAELAMEELKHKLTSPPVLVHYDQGGELTVRCDASGYGIGAVLMQNSSDKLKTGVVAYTSRTLSTSEKNYATTHRECLAMVHAVKHWRHYLYGKQFEVVTDHHALCWLMRTKDHTNQLMRWSLILQEYTFKVKYESGKTHDDADCLSRYPQDVKTSSDVSDIPTWPLRKVHYTISAMKVHQRVLDELAHPVFDIIAEQTSDEFCKKAKEVLLNPESTKKAKKPYKKYIIQDDKLYRRSKEDTNKFLLVIPRTMVGYVLNEAHDKPVGGHFGIKRTLETLKQRFFWPSMDNDIRAYVSSCDACQKRKVARKTKEGFMIPMPIPKQVFEIIGMDLMGPLPTSSDRNKWILVITDYLSKYVIVRPLKSATTEQIIAVLREDVFYSHGLPKTVISDNGSNLTSFQMRDVFRHLGIEQKTTSPYRPQTNGQTERYNRVLGTQLAIFAEENQRSWDRYLHALAFAYNTTIHASHLSTPYFIVYGRHPLKPIDLAIGTPILAVEEGVQELGKGAEAQTEHENLNKARDFAKKLIESNQLKSKLRFDKDRKAPSYKVNDLVLIDRRVRFGDRKKKLSEPNWKGPYVVVKRISDVNFQVQLATDSKHEYIVHVQQMKTYHSRDSTSPRLEEGKTMFSTVERS